MLSKHKVFQAIRAGAIVGLVIVVMGAIALLHPGVASANRTFPTAFSAATVPSPNRRLAQAFRVNGGDVTVYRDPNCSCCEGWMTHLRSHGFRVSEVQQADMASIKQHHGIPDKLTSCHTAMIDGKVIEGHVPAGDIQQFLAVASDAVGLAIPGMPIGSPGMEEGDTHEPFTVLTFDAQGNADAFHHYPA
ncbi:DUF411 domain-containing protein [Leptolyngbya sp. AN02str]|uniref:DUF411 domain-containing protein n=1 Tax=Leptolyngbya sp. AN02str TaxID=3423363 RepID=UPI003D31DC1C